MSKFESDLCKILWLWTLYEGTNLSPPHKRLWIFAICRAISPLPWAVLLSNLASLLILWRSFQQCRRILLTDPYQLEKIPRGRVYWKRVNRPPSPPPQKKANKGSKITFNALHFVAFFISEHRNGVMQAILTFRSVNKVMMSNCVFLNMLFLFRKAAEVRLFVFF